MDAELKEKDWIGVKLPMMHVFSPKMSYHYPIERNSDGSLTDKSRELAELLTKE